MVSRRILWILVIIGVVWYLYYHSQPRPAVIVHQKHLDSANPKEPTPYDKPDGGFGTIDGAKDVRDEANRESARPQKAQEAIDRQ